MGSVYHYCSLDTFYKVISNKCIRLSDLNKTNDYMEKRWISKILYTALKEELKECGITINLAENYWYSEGINSHLQYLEDTMNEFIYTSSPTLITCFSKKPDKLSQWRAYGDDGFGVSIGFDYDKLKQLKNINDNLFIKELIYKETKQITELRRLIRSSITHMRSIFKFDKLKKTNNFNEYFIDEFDSFCEVLIYKEIECMSCYIKNPAFIEEEEVRIIYIPGLYVEMEDNDLQNCFNEKISVGKYSLDSLKYYCRDKQLVAYSDLCFERLVPENIINEIVLGPKSKLMKEDIFYYLFSHGYNARDIIINKSNATYR